MRYKSCTWLYLMKERRFYFFKFGCDRNVLVRLYVWHVSTIWKFLHNQEFIWLHGPPWDTKRSPAELPFIHMICGSHLSSRSISIWGIKSRKSLLDPAGKKPIVKQNSWLIIQPSHAYKLTPMTVYIALSLIWITISSWSVQLVISIPDQLEKDNIDNMIYIEGYVGTEVTSMHKWYITQNHETWTWCCSLWDSKYCIVGLNFALCDAEDNSKHDVRKFATAGHNTLHHHGECCLELVDWKPQHASSQKNPGESLTSLHCCRIESKDLVSCK